MREADIHEVDWNAAVPTRSVTKVQEVVGRGVVMMIYKDEPFMRERIAEQGAGAGLAATIPLGMRAVALRVNDVIGLAGFVLPGMRVDVVVSGNAPQATQAGTVSRTVLQNIQVLSAGQKIERNVEGKPEDAQVVNLLVTPDQAEILSLANNETKVQLVLRNPMDIKNEPTRGASVAALFGNGVTPVALPRFDGPKASKRSQPLRETSRRTPDSAAVEVFSGSKRSEAIFAEAGRN